MLIVVLTMSSSADASKELVGQPRNLPKKELLNSFLVGHSAVCRTNPSYYLAAKKVVIVPGKFNS